MAADVKLTAGRKLRHPYGQVHKQYPKKEQQAIANAIRQSIFAGKNMQLTSLVFDRVFELLSESS